MEGAAETGFKIAQQDVDPAELGEIIGMTATCDDSGVAAACGDAHTQEHGPDLRIGDSGIHLASRLA